MKCVAYDSNKYKTANIEYGNNQSQEKLLAYVVNDEKTENETWKKMLLTHDDDDGKNYNDEKEFFVDGIMCNRDNVHNRMMNAQKMSDKKIVNLAYHAVQSFKEGPGEMTASQAHEIGMRLARELWSDYVVLVATHLNTGHYHNHFVICSTSPLTGKRFNKCNQALRDMRNKSDELCREYGLHVITERTNEKAKSQAEAAMAKKHIPTHRELLKNDCDIAIEQSEDWNSFLHCLQRLGYKIKKSNTFISLTAERWRQSVRIYYDGENNRGLGREYTREQIIKRIEESVKKKDAKADRTDRETTYLYKAKTDNSNISDNDKPKKENSKGNKFIGTVARTPEDFTVDLNAPLPTIPRYKFKGTLKSVIPSRPAGLKITYYRLSYKMCILPKPYKRHQKKRMSLYMRSELNKLHRYIDEVNFLANTGIDNMSQLNTYKDYAESQVSQLENERRHLRNKLRRCTDAPIIKQTKSKISDLTKQISTLRKQIRICTDIADNTENVRYKVNEDSRIEEQELRKNEISKTKYKTERKFKL